MPDEKFPPDARHAAEPLPHDRQVPAQRPRTAGCTCAYRFVGVGPGRVESRRTPDPACPQH